MWFYQNEDKITMKTNKQTNKVQLKYLENY